MRIHHKKYSKFRIICVLIVGLCIHFNINANTETGDENTARNIVLYVVDDTGLPVTNLIIKVNEKVVKPDDGSSFMLEPDDIIQLSAAGFETSILSGRDAMDDDDDNVVILTRSTAFMSPDDDVPLPYMTLKRRHTTGSYSVIRGEDLERYPSADLRLAFSDITPGLRTRENHGAPGANPQEPLGWYGLTEKVSISARGRSMVHIIDGIPTDLSEIQLDPNEVESVTVIRDIVGKAMYGPLGADGILLIKTRRGAINESYLNVNIESGTGIIDRFPEWVSGANYARLNNQARAADGLDPLYSQGDISAYERKDPYDLSYPSVDYRDYMLENTRTFQRANVSARGGSESVQYSSYLGFNREGDIFNIGSTADFNRLNLRSNIDVVINDFITAELDIHGIVGIRRSPGYGYTTSEGQHYMRAYEFDIALEDIIRTPPIEFPVYTNTDSKLVRPWYGISSRYGNPIGNFVESGYYNEQNRQAGVKSALNYDMSHFINGLSSRTAIGFDVLNLTRIGQANRYEGYRVNIGDNDTTFTRVQSGIVNDIRRRLHDHYYQRVAFTQNLAFDRSFGDHDIQSSVTYFLYRKLSDRIRDPQPHQLGVWMGKYTFNDKYTLQGVLNYAGTFSFAKENRAELFPAVGASWLISEEGFMQDIQFVNFLKLRAEAGVNGYDPYLNPHIVQSRFILTTRSDFGPHPMNRWFGTTVESSPSSSYPSWVGNPDLTWEKRREFSAGLDGLFLNHKLLLDISYYNNLRDGIITRLPNSLPDVAGFSGAMPYFNSNQYRYYGVETGAQWTDISGRLEWSMGAALTFQNTEIVRYDEPNYRDDYQFRTGHPVDTYWGLSYKGKFASDEEARQVPQLFDPVLSAGDLKYEDMNGDGVVDENDYSAIGNTTPKVFYSLNASLRFGQWDMNIVGTGAAFYDIPLTSEYYHNGWGTDNYSAFVRDNLGGDYPRLTYFKVNNNFEPSDFWLTRGDYFKIKNVEIAYTISGHQVRRINFDGMRIFVRGSNLLTISAVKDIDPESSIAGISAYPLYRTFTGGISFSF